MRPGGRAGHGRDRGTGVIHHLPVLDRQPVRGAPGGEGIYGACKAAPQQHRPGRWRSSFGQHRILGQRRHCAGGCRDPADRALARDRGGPPETVGVSSSAGWASLEDAAAAAVYFAADEAEWVSGAVLPVSGGAVMTSDPYRYLMRVNKAEG